MLSRILNIIIVFQHFLEVFINAYKRRLLSESFFVNNRGKTLIIIRKQAIIALKEYKRFIKKVKTDFSFSQPSFFKINRLFFQIAFSSLISSFVFYLLITRILHF